MTVQPLVTILMATHNGAEFLPDQMDSIAGQTHGNWRLLVGDDGSKDATLALLETFKGKFPHGQVTIHAGPMRGATANFLDLLDQTSADDGLLAFCDQDDVWLSEKLERAVAQLGRQDGPVLYACRAIIADAAAIGDQVSAMPKRALSLAHALAENVLTGNSMVMNPSAAQLLRDGLRKSPNRDAIEAGFHDWWAYQVIASAKGTVILDPVPGLRYRQHGRNLVGSGQARGQSAARIGRVLGGAYAMRLRRQAQALLATAGVDSAARERASEMLSLRSVPIWKRPGRIAKLRINRQSRVEDLLLKALLLLGRV